jgi:ribosomal protein S27AE
MFRVYTTRKESTMTDLRFDRTQCSSCGADVFFAPTEYMHRGIWDWTPRADGGYAPHPDGRMLYVKRQPGDTTPRYISHFATCPTREQHRRVTPARRTGPEDAVSTFKEVEP